VYEERPDTLEFFKLKGFEVIAEEEGKYKKRGGIECILKKVYYKRKITRFAIAVWVL